MSKVFKINVFIFISLKCENGSKDLDREKDIRYNIMVKAYKGETMLILGIPPRQSSCVRRARQDQ